MSILQVLEESLHSDAPCYMEFLYRYDPKKQQCFAFYEGDEDSSFYHHFLKEAIGEDCALEEIVAGCKNSTGNLIGANIVRDKSYFSLIEIYHIG